MIACAQSHGVAWAKAHNTLQHCASARPKLRRSDAPLDRSLGSAFAQLGDIAFRVNGITGNEARAAPLRWQNFAAKRSCKLDELRDTRDGEKELERGVLTPAGRIGDGDGGGDCLRHGMDDKLPGAAKQNLSPSPIIPLPAATAETP
ncbi:hypothetical protein [Xanthomonas campestris]|uniref:hypothetical protein n=1 Tax=Xanthomonas campestris TaxID=339 RepID=UPI00388D8652